MSDFVLERIDPAELTLARAEELAALQARAQACGRGQPATAEGMRLAWKYGEGEGPIDGLWIAREGAAPVGFVTASLPKLENTDVMMLRGGVDPAHRRQGIGTALIDTVLAAHDRPRLRVRVDAGSIGEAGLVAMGFTRQTSHVVRHLDLTRRHPASAELRAAVRDAAAGYDFSRWLGPTRPEQMPDMVVLREAINDAPDPGDYEAYPPDRIAAYEDAMTARGITQYAVMAHHRATGEPAGLTFVSVDERDPTLAHQEDTSVVRAHRGHRLGTVLKLEVIDWLREERPDVEATETLNAHDNHHMIAVNEALGSTVVGESAVYLRDR